MRFLWTLTLWAVVAKSYCSETASEPTGPCDYEAVMKVVNALEKRVQSFEVRVEALETENRQLKALLNQQVGNDQRPDTGEGHSEDKPSNVKGHHAKYRIQRANTEVTIAFYAALQNTVTHLGQGQNVRFDNVVTNVGNSYDAHTGAFRAPVAGVYVFSTTVLTNGHDTTHYGFALNGKTITMLFVHGAESSYDADSQTIILQLQQGDDVSIQHTEHDKSLDGYNQSVFSGFLLSQSAEGPDIVG